MECNCSLKDGIHDASCRSNNEYEYYRCSKCGTPTWQSAMAYGVCQKCRES